MANDLIVKLLDYKKDDSSGTMSVTDKIEYRIEINGIYTKQEALILAKKIKSVVYESKIDKCQAGCKCPKGDDNVAS
jgi:hypothetical protein